MNARLTQEQINALASGDELEFIDPSTNRVYVLVDQVTLLGLRETIRLQHQHDVDAIKNGIDDMAAGRTESSQDSHLQIREQLKSRYGE